MTHLKGISWWRDVTEQVHEQGLSRGSSLKHPCRGPTDLYPQLQDGIHLSPNGTVV